jgi:7-carboxy-7-deazaguanine synthase
MDNHRAMEMIGYDASWADHGLDVSEVFGPVYQGEGPFAGRRCHFIRLMRCNLSCSWCDTPFTWDASRFDLHAESTEMTPLAIADQVADASLVVISGGEPLMWQNRHAFVELIDLIPGAVHVETNGTIHPSGLPIDHYVVSPKVNDQGDPLKKRIKFEALRSFAALADQGRASIKIVVRDADEVHRAADLMDGLQWPHESRWVMPEGTSATALLAHAAAIEEAALTRGLNLSLRQHVLLHGDQRGY